MFNGFRFRRRGSDGCRHRLGLGLGSGWRACFALARLWRRLFLRSDLLICQFSLSDAATQLLRYSCGSDGVIIEYLRAEDNQKNAKPEQGGNLPPLHCMVCFLESMIHFISKFIK